MVHDAVHGLGGRLALRPGTLIAGGAGSYEGLWTLIREFYRSLATGSQPPVTPQMIEEVGAMVTALEPAEANT